MEGTRERWGKSGVSQLEKVNIWDLAGRAIFLPSSDAVRTGHMQQLTCALDCIVSIKIPYNGNLSLSTRIHLSHEDLLFKTYVLLSPADVKARTATGTLMSDYHERLPRNVCTQLTAPG